MSEPRSRNVFELLQKFQTSSLVWGNDVDAYFETMEAAARSGRSHDRSAELEPRRFGTLCWSKESTGKTQYQYTPLNSDRHEIRLLHVPPGNFSDPIHLELEVTQFTEDHVPDFNALSYCWGSADNPEDVFIGESDDFTLPVTRNLFEALPYLRHTHRRRVLWIDAICVNQKDPDERSQQVKRMADIYSKARRVLVWLGPHSDGSGLAMDCIEEVASHIEVNFDLSTMQSITDETDWADKTTVPNFKRHEFLAISNFLGRSWFQRLWVWQEVHLAYHYPIVLCGKRKLSWRPLSKTVYCLRSKPFPFHDFTKVYVENCNRAYELCSNKLSSRFENLIFQTRDCKYTDPRDRVFRLLSLVDPSYRMNNLEVSYTKGVFKVYQEAFLCYSQNSCLLNLLCTIKMHEHLLGVPSWVPDWSTKIARQRLREGLAGGFSDAIVPVNIGNTLPLMGVIIDKIESVQQSNYPDAKTYDQNNTAQELRRVVTRMGITGPFIHGSKLVRDLCVVLTGNNFSETLSPG